MRDVGEIANMLTGDVESICRELLPNGRIHGREYLVGSVQGEEGQSLRIRLSGGKAGVWKDFAEGSGGDLIDLHMAVTGCSVAESVTWAKEYLGIKDDKPKFTVKKKEYKLPEKPKCRKPQGPVQKWFAARKITPETIAAYHVGENGNIVVFPYLVEGVLKYVKNRDVTNKEKMWSSADSEPCLFGWQVVKPTNRACIITEGEPDAMAYHSAGVGIPALSVPRGGGDGDKQNWLEYEFERLSRFDKIYLSLDADEPGQTATQVIMQRLGQHRCFVVNLAEHKDANDALVAGYDLVGAVSNARTVDPEELRSAESFHDETMLEFQGGTALQGITLPWKKTHDYVRVRPGEISVWFGINGHGKSQLLGHVAVGTMAQGCRWCIASMEIKPSRIMCRMYRQIAATNQPTPAQGEQIKRFITDRAWLFNIRGTAKAQRILDVFEYAYRRYGVTHFLVDSLAKCGFAEDDYNGQKSFVDALMEFSAAYDVHVHLVVHSRKSEGENKPPNKMDVKGTGAITDMVDNVFLVWRNKPKEESMQKSTSQLDRQKLVQKPDCLLKVLKQRNGEWEGTFALWFDKRSLQYINDSSCSTIQYLKDETPFS